MTSGISWRDRLNQIRLKILPPTSRRVEVSLQTLQRIEAKLDQLEGKAAHQEAVLNRLNDFASRLEGRKLHDSYDLRMTAEIDGALSSAKYFNTHLAGTPHYYELEPFLKAAVEAAGTQKLYLEFGVFSGRSVNIIAEAAPNARVVGFDSFEGLPERWRDRFDAGAFATDGLPEVRDNVELIKGWFDDTLPEFVKTLSEPVGFVHVDCDLYSSTKTIFDTLRPHFADEVFLIFDEYFNYAGWEQHEFRAFQELIAETGWTYEYLFCVPIHQQVAVRLNTKTT